MNITEARRILDAIRYFGARFPLQTITLALMATGDIGGRQ